MVLSKLLAHGDHGWTQQATRQAITFLQHIGDLSRRGIGINAHCLMQLGIKWLARRINDTNAVLFQCTEQVFVGQAHPFNHRLIY